MTYSPVNEFTFPFNPLFPMLPAINFITGITRSNPAIITTATDHGYSDGLTVRVVFPHTTNPVFGMTQIDEQTGQIVVLSSNSFAININSTNYDPFVLATSPERPQVIPIAVAAQTSANDSGQVNPINPTILAEVPIFQPHSPQCSGPCTVGG